MSFMTFHNIWEYIIIPTDELIFFRGAGIPPTRFYMGPISWYIPFFVNDGSIHWSKSDENQGLLKVSNEFSECGQSLFEFVDMDLLFWWLQPGFEASKWL